MKLEDLMLPLYGLCFLYYAAWARLPGKALYWFGASILTVGLRLMNG